MISSQPAGRKPVSAAVNEPGLDGLSSCVGVIITAAGESRRMAGYNKIFAPLLGRPLITYSVQPFHDASQVDAIVLVLPRQDIERGRRLAEEQGWSKVIAVCPGGERRQDSVRNGLEKLPSAEWIIIHDGARPCVTPDVIARGLAEVRETEASVAAVPVTDTVKRAGTDLLVRSTVPRNELWTVQTPQVFSRRVLADAHARVTDDATDDAAMVERVGGAVKIYQGSFDNIKVTTRRDLHIAEAILAAYGRGDSGDVP